MDALSHTARKSTIGRWRLPPGEQMSAVVVKLKDNGNGFKEVSVDGRRVGKIEDPEDNLFQFMKKFIEELQVDNTVVMEEKFR